MPIDVLQRKVFLQRKSAYDAQMQNYDAQIASAQANLKTAQDEEKVLIQRLETMKSIEAMRSYTCGKGGRLAAELAAVPRRSPGGGKQFGSGSRQHCR